MIVVTVATHERGYFKFLKESCKKHNLDLHVLGMGKVWEGFQWKYSLMKQFLRTRPVDEVVVFVDGYDVFALADEKTIESRFKSVDIFTNVSLVHLVKDGT